MGRLVVNHSTYIDGLLLKLKKLSKLDGIRTVTPGVISTTKGKVNQLTIKKSTRIRGGFKLIARRGSSVQEIFIITNLNESEVVKILENL